MKNTPFILSIVGKSDSGKTTTILKLLPEFKKRGKAVAVAKHCPRGFDLDHQGKDSFKFAQAGSKGVFLTSSDTLAWLRPRQTSFSLKQALKDNFSDFDIVLTEGYNDATDIKKIQVFRDQIGGEVFSGGEIVAYVSDAKLQVDKPVFGPDDIEGIIGFIESL